MSFLEVAVVENKPFFFGYSNISSYG